MEPFTPPTGPDEAARRSSEGSDRKPSESPSRTLTEIQSPQERYAAAIRALYGDDGEQEPPKKG